MANMKNKENPNPENARNQKHADAQSTDNDHQKTVQGKNQRGPADKAGRDAGGSHGSRGQNLRGGSSKAKADLQWDPTSQAATVPGRRRSSTSTTTTNGSKDRLRPENQFWYAMHSR